MLTTIFKRTMAVPHSFLSSQYINGIYIPSGLLLVGIAIVKKEWLPYAVVVAILLGSWKIYSNRQSDFSSITCLTVLMFVTKSEPKKCLNSDEYHEFPLKEKTIISHNVAM